MIILICFCFKSLTKKQSLFFSIMILFFTTFYSTYYNFNQYKNYLTVSDSRLPSLCSESFNAFKYYSKEFNKDTYLKICRLEN